MPADRRPPRALEVARAFTAAVDGGRLDLPLPGSGGTLRRWRALVDLAADDLSVARLAEGHLDALAVLDELGGPPAPTGARWGVWAARPPGRCSRLGRSTGAGCSTG